MAFLVDSVSVWFHKSRQSVIAQFQNVALLDRGNYFVHGHSFRSRRLCENSILSRSWMPNFYAGWSTL